VRLRQPTATLALFQHLAKRDGLDAMLAFHWGEVYRLRGWEDDRQKALSTYARALAFAEAPVETHRSIGLVRRALGQRRGARFAFQRYLAVAPDAADQAIVQTYIAEAL
jgi:beta-barrel assembly-enhancing protease